MADGKKSFVLYCDQIHAFETLSDEEAGRLVKHIFKYVNDQNPQAPDRITEISFAPIKQQLKRDLKDWEESIKGKSEGGKRSAAMRKQLKEMQEELSKLKIVEDTTKIVEKKASNSTVNVNVNVNDNVNVSSLEEIGSEKVKSVANEVWKDESWKSNMCIGLSLHTDELKRWLAMFNSSVANDKISNFDKGSYKKMSRGWISKQQAKGTTVESNGVSKKSDSAPLTRLKAN